MHASKWSDHLLVRCGTAAAEGSLSADEVDGFRRAFMEMIDRQRAALEHSKASARSSEEEVARLINAAAAELVRLH